MLNQEQARAVLDLIEYSRSTGQLLALHAFMDALGTHDEKTILAAGKSLNIEALQKLKNCIKALQQR